MLHLGIKRCNLPAHAYGNVCRQVFFLRLVIKVFFERLVTLPAGRLRFVYWGWTPQTPPQKKPLRRFLLFFSDRFFLNDWFFFYDWFFFNDWLRKKTTQNGIPFFCPVTPCFPFHRFQKKSKKYVKDFFL